MHRPQEFVEHLQRACATSFAERSLTSFDASRIVCVE
jgi:hypothetical protein